MANGKLILNNPKHKVGENTNKTSSTSINITLRKQKGVLQNMTKKQITRDEIQAKSKTV